ncbi:MAG: hypothetical protein GY794_15265, partial [bacterium]|nr:hypothetical protein [bacterium]
MVHKRKTELLRDTVTDLTRQWEVLDKALSDIRVQHLLETRSWERAQLEEKQSVIEGERGNIEKELQDLDLEYQEASRQEQSAKQVAALENKAADQHGRVDAPKSMLRHYMVWLYHQCG